MAADDQRDELAPAPGDEVAGYKLGAPLGEGGMGWVYEATGPEGERVAFKVVKPRFAADEEFRRRFKREVESSSKVEHPSLVSILKAGESDGVQYLIQPLIRGGSLKERVRGQGPLEVGELVDVSTRVAAGLDALHGGGLVHRDLKPANILLDDDGAYITDFGLIKDLEATVLTRHGQTLGTMDYMAPEQVKAEGVTPASDVYALGCVVFECVAGKPPFADKKGTQILWAHIRDEPPDPCAERDDVPDSLSPAILQALQKEPGKRPPNATGYVRMIQAAAGMLDRLGGPEKRA